MTMIPPSTPHQELPSDTVSRYLAVMIDKDYFESKLALYNRNISPESIGKPIPVCDRVVSAVKEFLAEYEGEVPGYQHLLAASGQTTTHLLIRLLLNLSRESEKTTSRMGINKADYPNDRIFIFRVPNGEAQYWDMSCNCREKDMMPIVF